LVEYLSKTSSSGGNPSALFSVAVIGMPNSGKSAVINTICGMSRLATYKPDTAKLSTTTTTLSQSISYEASLPGAAASVTLQLIDTPGFDLVPTAAEMEDGGAMASTQVQDALLRSRGRIEKMKQPELAVQWIASKANREDLMLHYNTPAYVTSDPNGFLSGHARATGRLKKGGVLDLIDSARSVLRDWRVGKFPYYTTPPSSTSSVATLTPQADAKLLSEIYTRTDDGVLSSVHTRKELRAQHGLIRMTASGDVATLDLRDVVLLAPAQPEAAALSAKTLKAKAQKVARSLAGAEESEAEAESSEEEDANEAAADEDDEDMEDEEDEKEEASAPPLSSKRKRAAGKLSAKAAPPSKKVSFAPAAVAAAGSVKGSSRGAKVPTTNPRVQSKISGTSAPVRKISNAGTKKKSAVMMGTASEASGSAEAYDFKQFF